MEKELEAHKEMVVELRRQLEEKENDLQVGSWEGLWWGWVVFGI